MSFDQYHFHIYFNKDEVHKVDHIIDKLRDFERLKIGRVRVNPVGPHPTGSCQITVLKPDFMEMLDWFLLNREGLSVFIHPVSGDDIKDHSDYTIWIGGSRELNLDFFRKSFN
ncbi:MAG: DOPA 4,5-dioxygenase family protein [Pseudobacteriovorax sp.]|nr:DOPA 4,5-dioxygenase family protein [Pseudobacteriovorax sp.]